jgi:hypothetical protein
MQHIPDDEPLMETIDWQETMPEAKAAASRLAQYIMRRGIKNWLVGVRPQAGGFAVILCRDTQTPREAF